MNNKAKHFWDQLEDGEIINWEIIKIERGKANCCCGTPIKNIYIIQNKITKKTKLIGCQCANRIGIKLSWKTKADYLGNAFLMARNQKEKDFIKQQQDRLPKWGESIIMSVAQVKWLEGITKKKWKGKVWGGKQ
jgi:hypothetical protein